MDNKIVGLKNRWNNMCFLNSLIQSLFNLCSIRELFKSPDKHIHSADSEILFTILKDIRQCKVCDDKNLFNGYIDRIDQEMDLALSKKTSSTELKRDSHCLVCILTEHFHYFNFSESKKFDLIAIRDILINLNDSIEKFDKDGPCCSAETLEEILKYCHRSTVYFDYVDIKGILRQEVEELLDACDCGSNPCLAHKVFATSFQEDMQCRSCNVSIPGYLNREEKRITSVYVYFSDFLNDMLTYPDLTLRSFLEFEPLVKKGKFSEILCEKCNSNIEITIARKIIKPAQVLVFNLIYPSNTLELDKTIWKLIYSRIDNSFTVVEHGLESSQVQLKEYSLRGLICIRKNHYIFVGFVLYQLEWYIFNDESLDSIGGWNTFREYLITKKWLPVLVLYEEAASVEKAINEYSDYTAQLVNQTEKEKENRKCEIF